ncbi:oxidoreductase-like domain-containing protein [Brachymonas denitrificans]|uniref:oxidoreductase-like domain-containing protein n=1 Tax=Brachymonas denitrificans TaxID=28220 RepID=UPI003220377A
MSHSAPEFDPDPMPQPPEAPDWEACCGNGCEPCILDDYYLAMDAYRQRMREWRARHPDTATGQD